MLLNIEKSIMKCEQQLLQIIEFLDNEFDKGQEEEWSPDNFSFSNYTIKHNYMDRHVVIEKEGIKFIYNGYISHAYVADSSLDLYGEFKLKKDNTIDTKNIKAKSLYFIEGIYKLLIEGER